MTHFSEGPKIWCATVLECCNLFMELLLHMPNCARQRWSFHTTNCGLRVIALSLCASLFGNTSSQSRLNDISHETNTHYWCDCLEQGGHFFHASGPQQSYAPIYTLDTSYWHISCVQLWPQSTKVPEQAHIGLEAIWLCELALISTGFSLIIIEVAGCWKEST